MTRAKRDLFIGRWLVVISFVVMLLSYDDIIANGGALTIPARIGVAAAFVGIFFLIMSKVQGEHDKMSVPKRH